jgi:L-fucose mutarotase
MKMNRFTVNMKRYQKVNRYLFPRAWPDDPCYRSRTSTLRAGRQTAATARPIRKENHMLKGIDPKLNADVLFVLRSMGHGDTLIIADQNFPADSVARLTTFGRPCRMDSLTGAQAVRSVLSVLPLDTFVDDFAGRMAVVGNPDEVPAVQAEVQAEIDRAEGRSRPMVGIERYAFYDLARKAFAVIQTGERRFYGCFMLRKGVIHPDG